MPGLIAVSMCLSPSTPCIGESGCTEISRMSRLNSRSRRPTPMNVPLVPSPATKCVMRPSVCSMISGAGRLVVRAPVGVVVVLIGVEVALRIAGEQPPRLADGAVGAFHRIGQDQLGAEGLQACASARA